MFTQALLHGISAYKHGDSSLDRNFGTFRRLKRVLVKTMMHDQSSGMSSLSQERSRNKRCSYH